MKQKIIKINPETAVAHFLKEHNLDVSNESFLIKVTKIWASSMPNIAMMRDFPQIEEDLDGIIDELVVLQRKIEPVKGIVKGRDIDVNIIKYEILLSEAAATIETIKDVFSDTRKRAKVPGGQSQGLTNKWLFEISPCFINKNGTHKNKVNWPEVQNLAKYIVDVYPECKGLLTPIINQATESLKSRLNRYKADKSVRRQFQPNAFQVTVK